MIHGYLILVHNNLELLLTQVQALYDGVSRFFIHTDKKMERVADNAAYRNLQQMDRVVFIENRVNVQWGSIRIVDATMLLLAEAIKYPELQYIHLLSGQCFPVKSLESRNKYLQNNMGKQFLEYFPLPRKTVNGWGTRRIVLYHFHEFYNPRSPLLKDKLIKHGSGILRKVQKILMAFGVQRGFPDNFPSVLYGGSAWWTISIECARYLVKYVSDSPEVYRRFSMTQLPDESFFQTVLLNSPFKNQIENNNVRFCKFEPGGSYAVNIAEEDIPKCSEEQILFARKFSEQNLFLHSRLVSNTEK